MLLNYKLIELNGTSNKILGLYKYFHRLWFPIQKFLKIFLTFHMRFSWFLSFSILSLVDALIFSLLLFFPFILLIFDKILLSFSFLKILFLSFLLDLLLSFPLSFPSFLPYFIIRPGIILLLFLLYIIRIFNLGAWDWQVFPQCWNVEEKKLMNYSICLDICLFV